jgi:DNA-binding FadR family transcriptional regulator
LSAQRARIVAGRRKTALPDAAARADDRTSVPDRIAAELIARIRTGALREGEALPTERDLCEAYNASRPTVREALSVMQARGYAATGGGKRPRAVRPSLDQILVSAADHIRDLLGDAESGAHLEQMRQFIEAGAVRGAAERASNIQIAKMQAALAANLRAIGGPDFAATDIAFHRAIVSVIGNPIILRLHDLFVSSMLAHRPKHTDQRAHDELIYEEHRLIYEAILQGDASRAADLIDRHLLRSYKSRLAAPKALKRDAARDRA